MLNCEVVGYRNKFSTAESIFNKKSLLLLFKKQGFFIEEY